MKVIFYLSPLEGDSQSAIRNPMERDCFNQIKGMIWEILNINLDCYKDEPICRRLDNWLFQSGKRDWDHYLQWLGCNIDEQLRFRDYLTINVSSFFRDRNRWKRLEEILDQRVLHQSAGKRENGEGLKVWSAGCSSGAEPYSLAILLEKLSPTGEHFLLATDLCRSVLARSVARGPYNAEEVLNLSFAQREVYLERGGPPFYVRDRLARKVKFREHNLLSDPFPASFDLIACRNVAIYLKEDVQVRLYQNFLTSLKPGGILFLGSSEAIPRFQDSGFQKIDLSLYQRV